ncbi:glycoside hydrolase family 13 protein [Mycena pura]|uniref:alpha-amylase n=1 Tax=Mycena pura TaxID=153505 RepID=A0AAD6YL71_9AGAR|nr:glycoside hydrolase family 13 protein [Mycena pura]
MYSHILLLCLTILLFSQSSTAASASEWRHRAIYQVVTDRFGRDDGSLTFPCDPQARVYCGGTWKGINNHLDYIQDMGFDAIWISPVVEQISGNTGEGEAYHGYWPKNIYAFNSKFGSEQDFKDLVAAVHKRGMLLMVDVVMNHLANQGDTIRYDELTPFNDPKFFHPKCDIDWGNQTSMEVCWMGNGYIWLLDIDTENPTVKSTLFAYIESFVRKYNVDALRLDASRNVPKQFWNEFSRAAGVYCQGEVWVKDTEIICPYQEVMSGLHNYPFKESATQAFTSSTGNMSEFVRISRQMQAQCKDVTLFGTFMENHDNPRLGSITTDRARLQNLAVLNMLADGIPIVYYGQEQMLPGSNDPMNREALWLTRYATTNNLVPTFTALNGFRSFLVQTAAPFFTSLALYGLLNSSVVIVRKGDVVLVLTNSGSGVATSAEIDGLGASMELVEILSCSNVQTTGSGSLKIVLTGAPMVLYPRKLLLASGICR